MVHYERSSVRGRGPASMLADPTRHESNQMDGCATYARWCRAGRLRYLRSLVPCRARQPRGWPASASRNEYGERELPHHLWMPTRTAAERPAAHLRHGQRGWSRACRAGSSGRAAGWLAHLCSSCHQPGPPRRRGAATWTPPSGGRSGPPRTRGLSYCHGSFNLDCAASRASRDNPADRPRRPRAAVRCSLTLLRTTDANCDND